MDTKEIEIVAPDGYELDKENSTFEKIIFKKIDNRPRTWEEFCERGFTGKEAYITNNGAVATSRTKEDKRPTYKVGYADSVEEAEAFVALMQLRQLRKAWVDDWEPDWKDLHHKYAIEVTEDYIRVYPYSVTNRALSFPTEEMAEEFIECFKDLLEQAKILL